VVEGCEDNEDGVEWLFLSFSASRIENGSSAQWRRDDEQIMATKRTIR
jgi:hypothetical protein